MTVRQLDFDDAALTGDYPRGRVDTSREAFDSMEETGQRGRQQVEALNALLSGPDTQEALSERTGIDGNSLRPRLKELEAAGLARRSEEKRPTRSGRRAHVWEPTEKARSAAAAQQ